MISDLATRTRLRVEIREVEPEDAMDALLARTVDVSLTLASTDLLPGQDDKRLHSEHLLDDVDGRRAALRPSAGRSGRDRTGRPADADWILARPGVPCWQLPGTPANGPGSCHAPGTTPTSSSAWSALIAAGHGVSLLPRLAQPEFMHEPIVLRPVAGRQPGPPDRRADPVGHRGPAAHRAGARVAAPDRRAASRWVRWSAGR